MRQYVAIIKLYGALLLVGVFSIVFSILTGGSSCVFYRFTGVPCPSCGMTRAWLHFFGGQVASAFSFHPLFWVILLIPLPYLPVIWNREQFTEKRKNLFYFMLVGLMLVVWVLRLILYFPGEPRMVFDSSAFVPWIVRRILAKL